MGRTTATESMADVLTREFHEMELPVNMFIEEQVVRRCGFDIRYLEEVETYGGHTDNYAHFHVVSGHSVMCFYYWEKDDKWYCKC